MPTGHNYLSKYDMTVIWNSICPRILQDLWISLGLIFDPQIAGLLEYDAWSYGLMPNCPCCFQLDPLQINLCEFDHTLEICLLSFFGLHPSICCSLIRTTRIFSQHTCHRACSHRSIHIQSGQHWVFKSVFVNKTRFSIRSSMSSCRSLLDFWSSVKNIPDLQNTAMLLSVSLWPIVQYRSLFTLHWNSSCAWRFTGSLGYLITQNTQHKRIFFAQCFRDKKDAGCSGGPKSSNSSAKTCHGGCVLGGCGGPSTRRPQFAYLHTLILLSLHLPQVHSQRHHALSPDLPHKHCSCHTCHARAPTLIFLTHILATPATPTSTQHFTYILATPATHRITYAHIFWRRLPRRTTDTKNENKTKKQNNNFHKVRSNASLEALPCSLHPLLLICTVQFFDLWNCCGSERHPPKNPKLRLQHTWFLESGFVTIFSRNQDIKNNNGGFAILKLLWCASGHIKLHFLDSRTNVFFYK